MPAIKTNTRALAVVALAGLISPLAATGASAGFHFGGGHGGGFGGGHFSMPHVSAPRMVTPRFSGRSVGRPSGGFSRPHLHTGPSRLPGKHAHNTPRLPHFPHHPHEPKIKIGHHRPGCHHGNCWIPRIPVVVGQPPAYVAPVYTPVRPAYATPVVAGPIAPKAVPANTCVAGGTFITIIFQPNASVAAVAGFLKEYDVVMADGPNNDGMFRIRLSADNVPLEKFSEMIESMKTKTDIVVSIAS